MKLLSGPAQTTISKEELSAVPNICRPRALGPVPRLGLGSRTTILGWPVIFVFLSETGVFANAIQNSVARELMPIEMLGNSAARQETLLPGLGLVPVGHTGSTIEGLVQWGALAAAKAEYCGPGFGADADHLPVYSPSSNHWKRTLNFIRCSREYSHFTLDIGSIVDWQREPVSRLADVPQAIVAAVDEIKNARNDALFDLEISLDESPEDISPSAAATTPEEMDWLLKTLATSSISPDYVAPHLGFTKGSDAADLDELATKAENLHRIAGEHLALLSIHSGDHLSSPTRKTLGQACSGKLLFKVSPALQDIYVNAILSQDSDLAKRLSTWVADFTSERGCKCNSAAEALSKYAFAAFGIRGKAGDFEMRDLLYSTGEAVKDRYAYDLTQYLKALVDDLMGESASRING